MTGWQGNSLGAPQGLDQGDWDPWKVFREEEREDRPVLSEDPFGSTERCAVLRKGPHPILGTLEATDLRQVEKTGEPECGVT